MDRITELSNCAPLREVELDSIQYDFSDFGELEDFLAYISAELYSVLTLETEPLDDDRIRATFILPADMVYDLNVELLDYFDLYDTASL